MLAVAHLMIKKNLYQKEFVEKFTEGFDEFAREMEPYTPAWAEDTGSRESGTCSNGRGCT